IKYVPRESLAFSTQGKSYYQLTAIDEFSRKRILKIIDEKSVTNTSRFLLYLLAYRLCAFRKLSILLNLRIKSLTINSMTALYLSILPRRKWSCRFMLYF
ncbi:Integrase core protein, partial [human gut metagenome]